ncbi:MAG: DUF4783 domain-containing protein [Chitinophagaceae bacterium]|nr:DUF4783 domain-containing protein [Chitinophagaceae bacterium]
MQGTLLAQDFLSTIGLALKQGKASAVAVYFDQTVDLSFSDKSDTYSKKQAELILQKFLVKVETKNYFNLQVGTSEYNHTKYSIGTLVTGNGNYKVYMLFVPRGGHYHLKELRFEK